MLTPAFRHRQSYEGSPLGLPVDVWLYIIRYLNPYDDEDKLDTMSLSATNKFFRDITLPFLYNTLDLYAPDLADDDTRVYVGPVIERVRVINSSPPILNAIRRLKLSNWIIRTDDDRDNDEVVDSYITDDEEYDPVRFREALRETTQLINDGYREIITLLSSLPRLHHLDCTYCILAPELFSYIFRIHHLQSLHIDGHSSVGDGDPIKFQADAPSLRVFQFTPNFSCIQRFLSITPNLYELRIIGDIHTDTPFIIPDTAIPNLKILIAPSCIANGIVSGRILEKLHIVVFSSRSFRESYSSISRDIKHLIYNGTLNNPKEDLDHLTQVFPSISTIEIMVMDDCTRSLQELSHAVLSILPKLRYLKQCLVSTVRQAIRLDYGPPSHCPIGRVDDPKYRSHPTLEELQILSIHRWIWDSEDGWYSLRLHGAIASPLHAMNFFDSK